jgi:hypothetical protein
MKRHVLIATLALALTACAATAPTPTPVPPSSAIIALAKPPAVVAPKPDTVTLAHEHWSLTVPATEGWTIDDDSEEGCQVSRANDTDRHVLPVKIFVASQKDVDDPQTWAMVASVMAEQAATSMGEIVDVKRTLVQFGGPDGTVASLTQVTLKNGAFVGQLAVENVPTKVGYAVICIAPTNAVDAKLMATITKTFTLK